MKRNVVNFPRLFRCLSSENGLSTPVQFDTHRVIKQLQQAGFDPRQSEAINDLFKSLLSAQNNALRRDLLSTNDFQLRSSELFSKLESVQSNLMVLEKSEFNILRKDNEDVTQRVTHLQQLLKDDLDKINSNAKLDFNLHKGWTKESLADIEGQLHKLNNRIEMEIAHINTNIEKTKSEYLRYQVGILLSIIGVTSSLIFGIWRASKT